MKKKPSKTKVFLWKFIPTFYSIIYHYQRPKRVKMPRQSQWGSWSFWGSLLIALSLDFTITRILFRFLIERILFRVLSDRVFFESSEIGPSSLGYAVIDSFHQSAFSAMSLFFLSNPVTTFFLSKADVLFCIHYNSQK